jgi:hypothetical protein
MTDAFDRVDRELASWLDGEPTRAPDRLLEHALYETRRRRQRPGVVAAVLGAPTFGGRATDLSSLRVAALLALLLASLLVVAILAAGAMRQDRVVVLPSQAAPTPTASPRPTPNATPTVVAVGSPRTQRFRDLSVTVPSGWTIGSGAVYLAVYPPGSMNGIPFATFRVDHVSLGSTFVLNLGQQAKTRSVSGATFEALVASIESQLALSTTSAAPSVLDGHRMIHWFVPQASYVNPLVWIAVIDDGDAVYLLQLHYFLDAPVNSDVVDTFLAGLHVVS